MPTVYEFDRKGSAYPFFLLTILCVIVIPVTIRFLRFTLAFDRNRVGKDVCACELCTKKARTYRRRHRVYRRPSFHIQLALLGAGWLAIFQCMRIINSLPPQPQRWDPFQLLDVSVFASGRRIKRQYKRLSVKYHPDKCPNDSQRECAKKFIELTKAYKALTDPIARENYLEYGHPDGEQDTITGIALPSQLVQDERWSYTLIFAYITLIVGVAPIVAAQWWIDSQSKTQSGLHVGTAYRLFSAATHIRNLDFANITQLLSECHEITDQIERTRKEINIEGLIQISHELSSLPDALQLDEISNEKIAEMLLYAHLNRQPLDNRTTAIKDQILVAYLYLAEEFFIFLTETRNSNGLKSSILLMQAVKQALVPGSFSVGSSCQNCVPNVRISDMNFYVEEETQLYTNSSITFTFNASLHDVDVESLTHQAKEENLDVGSKSCKPCDHNQTYGSAQLPWFPEYTDPGWYLFFTCPSQVNDMVTLPVLLRTIPYVNSRVQPKAFKILCLMAPNKPQTLKLRLHIMSDTYMGVDFETEVILNIVASKGRARFPHVKDTEGLPVKGQMLWRLLENLPLDDSRVEGHIAKILAMYYAFQEAKATAYFEGVEKNEETSYKAVTKRSKSNDQLSEDKPSSDCQPSGETRSSESDEENINSGVKDLPRQGLPLHCSPQLLQKNLHISPSARAAAKRASFIICKRLYFKKSILIDGLERHIPDTVAEFSWVDSLVSELKEDHLDSKTFKREFSR